MNPTIPERVIAEAHERDPASTAAEYGAQFRTDIESFVSRDALDAVTIPGRLELPPVPGVAYRAFVDPSGGVADAMTLAIAHVEPRDGRAVAVLDALREITPPLSPVDAVRDFAALCARYRITSVEGNRYGGEWPREQFRSHGLAYEPAASPKSDLYRDALSLINSGTVELLDSARLRAQLGALERRTARGGRDAIDHPPHQHDDVANAACGACVAVLARPRRALQVYASSGQTAPTPGDAPDVPPPRSPTVERFLRGE